MLSRRKRRIIAKEITDQTQDYFKKQQEKAKEEPEECVHAEEVKQKHEEKNEPSANFNKVFSQLVGKRQRTNTNPYKAPEINNAQSKKECHDCNDKKEEVAQTPNVEDEKKETVDQSAPISVFKKLSLQATAD